jgi:hypothetical protein
MPRLLARAMAHEISHILQGDAWLDEERLRFTSPDIEMIEAGLKGRT